MIYSNIRVSESSSLIFQLLVMSDAAQRVYTVIYRKFSAGTTWHGCVLLDVVEQKNFPIVTSEVENTLGKELSPREEVYAIHPASFIANWDNCIDWKERAECLQKTPHRYVNIYCKESRSLWMVSPFALTTGRRCQDVLQELSDIQVTFTVASNDAASRNISHYDDSWVPLLSFRFTKKHSDSKFCSWKRRCRCVKWVVRTSKFIVRYKFFSCKFERKS